MQRFTIFSFLQVSKIIHFAISVPRD